MGTVHFLLPLLLPLLGFDGDSIVGLGNDTGSGEIAEGANVIHSTSLRDELPDDQQEKSGIVKFPLRRVSPFDQAQDLRLAPFDRLRAGRTGGLIPISPL